MLTATLPMKDPLEPDAALSPGSPGAWFSLFGPGAVIASLTIGSGELIFSSRGGSIFGYRLLGLFLLVCLFKWVLVIVTARHMVLTGAHPFERWTGLAGPRGWLPMVFLLLAILSFPIWVGFHSGTLGTLVAYLTGTSHYFGRGMHLLWGMAILAGVFLLTLTGGYHRLEKIQLVIVLLMLGSVTVSLFLIHPDWRAMILGLLEPHRLAYADWAQADPSLRGRPVWVELTTYVGVIGGSGYDYLAYVSYLRAKRWGQAGNSLAGPEALRAVAADPDHPTRQWLRAPLIDATISFAVVFLFSAVFVAGGREILRAQHKIPEGGNLLTWQADFVAAASPWLKPLYFAGAFLALLGTLYGTIEVAPAILHEFLRAVFPERISGDEDLKRWRRRAVSWVGLGGFLVLVWMFSLHLRNRTGQPPGLVALLTPANLFTGVLACGLICGLSLWTDWRILPRPLRPGPLLAGLNILASLLFLVLGIKGYWDHSGITAFIILAGTLVLSLLLTKAIRR
jgi:Natural resistance-associated macrophage protein-like